MAVLKMSAERHGISAATETAPSKPEPTWLGNHDLRYEGYSEGRYEVLARLVAQIPRGSRVLDVGCGTGVLTSLIRDRCQVDIVGIEPNATRAETARERGLDVRTGLYDAEFGRRNGPFDVVILADVIEHIAEPRPLLNDLHFALAQGGRVIASVPNVAHWSVRLNLLRGRFEYQSVGIMDETHLRWYTRRSLVRLFQSAGFDVAQAKPTAGAWMRIYDRLPFGNLSEETRGTVIGRLAGAFPDLFGCQFVITATSARSAAGDHGGN